jgi:SAM-dependent methyltransferase
MIDLPLLEANAAWQSAWDTLMSDEWLRKKLNRSRRLQEHWEYVDAYAPELYKASSGCVLDLGPGAGELLEIARYYNHNAIGLDAPDGKGGMGNAYVRACSLMHSRQKLCVTLCGLDALLFGEGGEQITDRAEQFVLINSRGSFEQMFADCMEGEPHHLHHDCKRLAWRDTPITRAKLRLFFEFMHNLLRPGGSLLIFANGSANTDVGKRLTLDAAEEVSGLRLVLDDARILKWQKQTVNDSSEFTAKSASVSGPVEACEMWLGSCCCSDDLLSGDPNAAELAMDLETVNVQKLVPTAEAAAIVQEATTND